MSDLNPCPICGRRFTTQRGLTRHRRSAHSNHDIGTRRSRTFDVPGFEPEEFQRYELPEDPDRDEADEIYEGAGQTLGDRVPHDFERPDWDPLEPIAHKQQWIFCKHTIEFQKGKNETEAAIKEGYVNPECGVKTYAHFRSIIAQMTDGVDAEWKQSTINLDGLGLPFWHRDPTQCIRWLMRHAPFKDDLSYAPRLVYGSGGRLYNEMATGDWWWKEQVHLVLIGIVYLIVPYSYLLVRMLW
jgi:hypothetical protein